MKKTTNAVISLALLLVAGATFAQDSRDVHPQLTTEWWIDVGAYYPEREFTLSADGAIGGGNNEHEFDQQLGLRERDPLFEAEIGWQFGEKWGAAVQYFETSKKSRVTLEDEIEWEDVVYEVGADISAGTGLDVTRLVFSRRFLDRGPHDLRLAAGVHLLELSAFISGQARLGDMTTESRRSSNSASAPLPNIGVWYRYSTGPKWLFSVRGDWLEATIDKTSGSIINIMAGVNYSLLDNLGIGLAYQRFSIDVTFRESNWRGSADITFDGPNFFISGYW